MNIKQRAVLPILLRDDTLHFPNPRDANNEGLVAVGGDLSVPRLLLAYRNGIFPWTVNPISWWSPDPRAILDPENFRAPRSLEKFIRKSPFTITTNKAFRSVMEGCAQETPARGESWITPEFIDTYTRLHEQGHAHSVECWQSRELVGGIYGVSIGGFFAGESMFHRVSNASKVALYFLVQRLREHRFQLFDIQMITPMTRAFGAFEISRNEYLEKLEVATRLQRAFS